MGNDIEISVRVANNTATGLAAVNNSLNRLRDEARDAGRGLDGLAARAAAASVALRSLKDSAQDAARALRSLNTASRNADGRLTTLSDRSRTLRRDTDDLDGSMRRLTGTMGDLRGSNGNLRTSFGNSDNSMQRLKAAAIALSPALIPVAASLVPIAANAGAAGIAVGVFGAAMIGQLVAVKNAADAQQKYTDAVKKHGPASQQAAQAESLFLDQVQHMDPATRRTAAALEVLKDQYKDWSKSLAGDTMPVVNKGLAIFGALMPKLTPTVKGASTQLDRFMTILGGGINSSGFQQFADSFAKFSTGALSKANDGLVRFMRTMSGGVGSSQLSKFMEYAHRAGPQVGETLMNLARALAHLVAAASETGVGMLTLINSFAKLVNAVPTPVLSNLLQFVVVLKAVKLAAAGMAGMGGLAAFATSIGAMRTAAAGATGPLASLGAAFGALSRTAKVALVGTGIGLLVVALSSLSNSGKKTAPDVDRITTSLGELGRTGRATGEAVRVFGKGMEGLASAADRVAGKTSGMDKFNDTMNKVFTLGMGKSNSLKDAEKEIDALDKGLANLVKGGKAQLAAAALKELQAAYAKKGGDPKKLAGEMDDYKSALADAALEQKLAASSMGLFGTAAQATSAKLAAQKASADGLRQSIQALNDVNRQGLGGMIGFEAAIDATAKAAKDNAGALSMSGGVLNLNSEKARNAATALQDLADKTDSAAAANRESTGSWEGAIGIYQRGRAALIKNAEAMGLSKTEAAALASQILKIPNKTARFKMDTEDAKAGLNSFNAALKRTPGAKSVTLKTLSKGAEQILESFGLKVKRLPNGKVKVTAATGRALGSIGNVSGALRALNGKTARTYVTTYYQQVRNKGYSGNSATGGHASGGPIRLADGGSPDGGRVAGPGTSTSDSIPAMLSDGEYVVRASAVAKYGERFMDALNQGRLRLSGFAKGGLTQGMKDARNSLRDQFGISHFGTKAGYQRSPFEKALGAPSDLSALVSALNGARGDIKRATSGRTESHLLKELDSVGKSLIKQEKHLTSVNKALEGAKNKLNDLKSSASQLSSSVKSGVLSSANITQGAGADKTTTVASIMGGLTASRDKATAFSSALKGLRKKGLSKSLLQQIAEAGISGGGLETAGALLGASGSEIKSLNSLQSQIGKAASSAGKTTADAVYGASIKAQEKLIGSLKHQQNKLEKAMAHLAKVMEKAISRAVGKKASGGIVGAAASGGLRGGMTWVGEHEPELLDLPVGSRVRSGPDSRRIAASMGGGGAAHAVVEFRSSGSEFDEFLLKVMRRAVRTRGGNVQFVFTGRTT